MQLATYLGRRFLILLPQLFLISVVTFLLVRMLPGDPARLELGPLASDEGVAQRREELMLDSPLHQQYLAYLGRILKGDFGQSWVTSNDVMTDLSTRIATTLELIGLGLLVIMIVVIPLGVIAATGGGGFFSRVIKRITAGYGLLAGSLPDFWLGLLMIFVFFTTLGILPGPEGRLSIGESPPPHVTGFYTVDSILAGDPAKFFDSAAHLVLPVLTLAFVYGGPILKMTQSTMRTALNSDYSTYARGFGISQSVIVRQAFRNAAPPVVVISGVISGFLLGGAVLIETVFNLNGAGQYAVQSIISSDYSPIQAFVLIAAVFTMLVYLVVDLIYFAIDPRVRSGGKA